MTFSIAVNVNPSQPVSAAKQIGAAMAGAEAAGVKAGNSTTTAFDKASVAGQKAILAARNLAGAFGSVAQAIRAQALDSVSASLSQLTKQFEREAEILEQIQGPAKRYREDLAAIEMLHRKGMISAREYGQAVAEAHSSQRQGGGSVTMAPTPKERGWLPQAGDGADFGIAAAGAVGGAYLGKKALDVADEVTMVTNRLGYLTSQAKGASLSTEGLYDKLFDISQLTFTNLDATVTSFSGLTSATKKLGMTQSETIGLTETINKAIAVSGASAEQSAAGLMQLGQALSSGVLQGDEFRSISENLPYLRDLLAKSLGVGIDKLREMSSQGKLTSAVITQALLKSKGDVDAAFGNLDATFGQKITVAKNQFTSSVGTAVNDIDSVVQKYLTGNSAAMASLKAEQAKADAILKTNRDYAATHGGLNADGKRVDQAGAIIPTESLDETAARLKKVEDALNAAELALAKADPIHNGTVAAQDAFRKSLEDTSHQIKIQTALLEESTKYHMTDRQLSDRGLVPTAASKLALLAAGYEDQRLRAPGAAPAIDIAERIDTTKTKLALLTTEYKNGEIGTQAFNLATKQLTDSLTSLTGAVDYYKRVWDDIHQPTVDFTGSISALDAMMARGRITLTQYHVELKKLSESFAGSEVVKLLEGANGPKAFSPNGMDQQFAEHQAQSAYQAKVFESEADIAKQYRSPSEPDLNADLAAFDQRNAASRTPLGAAHDEWNDAKRRLNEGSISATTFADEVDKIRVNYLAASGAATTFAGGVELGFLEIAKQSRDSGALIRDSLVGAFQEAQEALARLLETGELGFDQLLASLRHGIAELASKQITNAAGGTLAGLFTDGDTPTNPYSVIDAVTRTDTTPSFGSGDVPTASARQAPPIQIHVHQDRNALLPALDSPRGRKTVANIVVRDSGIDLARRRRNS